MSQLLTAWESLPKSCEKSPSVWFQQLTDAFNASSTQQQFQEDDNLDTGNASPEIEPFRPFVDAMINTLLTEKDPHRRYTQLNAHHKAKDDLAASTRSAFTALGIANEPQSFACLAYGATQAWEACCRYMIQHPGDVVIVPTPTYTLLVPPVLLAQGTVEFVDIGPSGILTAEQLDACCTERTAALLDRWEFMLPDLMRVFAAAAEAALQRPTGTLFLKIPSDPSKLLSLFEGVRDVNARVRDTLLTTSLIELFAFTREETDKLKRDGIITRWFLPPRVAGLLFINPTLGGRYYTTADVASLAPVAKRHHLTVVEDLAYTLMPLDVSVLQTMGRFGCHADTSKLAITILGLSKPLSVANHRVSVVVGANKDVIDSVDNFIKASVAQVASYLYTAVTESLKDTDALVHYVKSSAADPSFGYKRKLRLALGCLKGNADAKLATELLQAVVSSGVSPSNPTIGQLAKKGLSDYFSVASQPEGGIFVLVDCAPLIKVLQKGGFKDVNTGYDVSIWLALALRIRVIPEEVMNGWGEPTPGTLLRLSFSVPSAMFVRAAFEMLKLFTELDQLSPVEGPRQGTGSNVNTPATSEPQHPSYRQLLPSVAEGRDLTPSEQSMFVEQMQRAKAYTVVSPTAIKGPLSVDALQKAIDVVVAQHPSLRFTFPFRPSNGKPCCCCTAPPRRIVVQSATQEAMRVFAEQDFNISSGEPLSAFGLFRVHPTEHILLLVQHHIVTDNGSIGIIMSDLFQVYGCTDEAAAVALPPPVGDIMAALPWSKTDDILWHADRLASLPLPFPLDGDAIESHDLRCTIDEATHQRILDVVGGNGTEFESMLAITAVALQATFSECSSFGILLPASLRFDRTSMLATGYGANSLVCRVDVDEEDTFDVLLKRTSESVRSSREHVSAPLPQVARYLREKKIERVGEIAIAVRPPPNPPISKTVEGGQTLEWSQVISDVVRVDGTVEHTAKHPISFVYSRRGHDKASGFDVDIIVTSATPPGTAERLLGALQHALQHLNPQLKPCDVDPEPDPFFASLHEPHVLLPHQLFKLTAQAGLHRALWAPEQSLVVSSAELTHRMMHIVALVQLRQWRRVALCLPAGVGYVVSLLGVLASGATCAPLRVGTALSLQSYDGALIGEGYEDSVSSNNTPTAVVRRDGTLSATVEAPSLPRKVMELLKGVRPNDIALEYTTVRDGGGVAETLSITHAVLRRQLRQWTSIFQAALPADIFGDGEGSNARAVSMCTSVDTPRCLVETVVPVLLGAQVILVPDARRVSALSVPVNTLLVGASELPQLLAVVGGASRTAQVIAAQLQPILVGPMTQDQMGEIFRALPHVDRMTSVFTPAAGGLLTSVQLVQRASLDEACRVGREACGARVVLVQDGTTTILQDSEKTGCVAVVADFVGWSTSANGGNAAAVSGPRVVPNTFGVLSARDQQIYFCGDGGIPPSSGSKTLRLKSISAAATVTGAAGTHDHDAASAAEETVKELFSSVLEIPKSSLTRKSDFFDVGGDSFTLSQLANHLQKHGAKLAIAVLINKLLRDMSVQGIALLLPEAASGRSGTTTTAAAAAPLTTAAAKTESRGVSRGATPQSRSRSSSVNRQVPHSQSVDDDIDWANEIG